MLTRLRKYAARRQAIRELESFSDRELRDIGIARGDIRAVVYGELNERRTT